MVLWSLFGLAIGITVAAVEENLQRSISCLGSLLGSSV